MRAMERELIDGDESGRPVFGPVTLRRMAEAAVGAVRTVGAFGALDDLLAGFPADWDVQVCVCCRGETFNGPRGVRRWTAAAVPRMLTPDEILAGMVRPGGRLESGCSDSPRDAVLELAGIVGGRAAPGGVPG